MCRISQQCNNSVSKTLILTKVQVNDLLNCLLFQSIVCHHWNIRESINYFLCNWHKSSTCLVDFNICMQQSFNPQGQKHNSAHTWERADWFANWQEESNNQHCPEELFQSMWLDLLVQDCCWSTFCSAVVSQHHRTHCERWNCLQTR